MTPIVAGALASAVATLAAGGLGPVVQACGPIDRPRTRGGHDQPHPTAGGLAILTGAAAGFFTFAALDRAASGSWTNVSAVLGFAAILGLMGGIDDLIDIGAKAKLIACIALALVFSGFCGWIETLPIAAGVALHLGLFGGVVGSALWLVVVTNAVNFMDGSDGLAVSVIVAALLALATAAFLGGDEVIGAMALVTAMANLGFLPWNFPRARLFQGDAGALFSSFVFAALALLAAGRDGDRTVSVWFAALVLLPFLTDVLLTLLARARAGQSLLSAHREHLYQRWLSVGDRPHAQVAVFFFLVTAAFGAFAVTMQILAPGLVQAGFIAALLISVSGWVIMDRKVRGAIVGNGG